jgi:hypothetical protein
MKSICNAMFGVAALLALSSCSQEDVKWETGREALGGIEADREQVDDRWSMYRDQVVRSLDLMKAAVRGLGDEGSVVDRNEIDGLLSRIEDLRRDFATGTEQPRVDSAARRDRLRGAFEAVRTDVDALLTRLGHSPDTIARWQDKP